MPDIRCGQCGKAVRVQGLAATCTHCGNLVTVVATSGERRADQDWPSSVPHELHAVDDADFVRGSFPSPIPTARAVNTPTQLEIPRDATDPLHHGPWRTILLCVFGFASLLITLDWVRLRFFSQPKQPTVVIAPPAPVHAARPATNRSRSIFDEEPPPSPSPPVSTVADPAPGKDPSPPTTPTADAPDPPRSVGPPDYPHLELARIKPEKPTGLRSPDLTDAQVVDSIRRGLEFLLGEYAGSRLKNGDNTDPETFAGRNALVLYAMLHANQALNDPRISPQTEFVKALLERVKDFPMNGGRAIYSRSLRLAALSVLARPEDRAMIERDADYLLDASVRGAFTYSGFAKDQRPEAETWRGWDNSNSQYGALGLWAAADAGFKVKNVFWNDVENHWVTSQTHTGGWAYGSGGGAASLAMTSAGITMLLVARDQLNTNESSLPGAGVPQSARSVQRGLEWLDEGNNAIEVFNSGHPGYTLYGLERAGLASGYKFFGDHDWYLELATRAISAQQPDGSWVGGDGPQVETAFTILFLARGRHPVLASKLEFEGSWNNNSRDLANLTRFAGKQLERPLNWQVVDGRRSWQEWSDSTLLYIASDRAPQLTDAQVEKLRAFVEAGGLIFTHADKDSADFTSYVEALARRLFPGRTLETLPEDHLVYSTVFPMKARPPLKGVSNGPRLVMVHSPTDLAKSWQRRAERTARAAFDMGLNVAIYASGKRELRNRVESLFVPDPIDAPVAAVPVARVRYRGNWDPEPGAWRRFPQTFQNDTRVRLDVKAIDAHELKIGDAPLAVLTGFGTSTFRDEEIEALRGYVSRGGVLFIDSCGGSREFAHSVKVQLLPRLSAGAELLPMPSSHAILTGRGEGMESIEPLRVRPFAAERVGSAGIPLQFMRVGAGHVILSEMDVTSGLLGTATWGIVGYQPTTASGLLRNIVLWSLNSPPR